MTLPARRRGFTLFELLLVLAVMALLAGITWPIANWWFNDYGLRRTAEELHVTLGRARVMAVDSGIPHEFRFEPGGRRFVVIPTDILEGVIGENGEFTTVPGQFDYLVGELSEDVMFEEAPAGAQLAESLNPRVLEGMFDGGQSIADAAWSPALVFHEDGTSDDVSFDVVEAEDGRRITLVIRGLTGAVSLSSIHAEDFR